MKEVHYCELTAEVCRYNGKCLGHVTDETPQPQSPPAGDRESFMSYLGACFWPNESPESQKLYVETVMPEAKAQLNAYILAEVLQTQINIWANFKHELTKRELSSDVMPKGARKMTEQELLAGVISQEQAKATARFGGES